MHKVYESKRLLRDPDASNESSYRTACAMQEILSREDEIMQVWKHSLDDSEGEDAYDVDENIKIENEDSDLDRERARSIEYPAWWWESWSKHFKSGIKLSWKR